ncbi:MAG: oligoendopeptidase F, partial [Rhodobacteraceae bacterium]|nr:oligoendopeptidase F [Paracoccaceae bacterium]
MLQSHTTPVFHADATKGSNTLGALPDWDFSDLYTAPDAPELAADLGWLKKACADFAISYEGNLAGLDAAAMLKCVTEYEAIENKGGRIMSYAGLRYYQKTTDAERAQFLQNNQEKITDYTAPLVFFSLEVNRIDDDALAGLFADNSDLARYEPVFERLRAMRPHQLSDELEKFLHDQSSVGAAA